MAYYPIKPLRTCQSLKIARAPVHQIFRFVYWNAQFSQSFISQNFRVMLESIGENNIDPGEPDDSGSTQLRGHVAFFTAFVLSVFFM